MASWFRKRKKKAPEPIARVGLECGVDAAGDFKAAPRARRGAGAAGRRDTPTARASTYVYGRASAPTGPYSERRNSGPSAAWGDDA